MHEVMETVKPMAAEKPVLLEVNVPEPSVLVWADRDKVTQVLMNLIGNAIKFTPPARKGYGFRRERRQGMGSGFDSMTRVPGFRRANKKRFLKSSIRYPRTEARNPKERGLASLSPKRWWSCMVEKFGLNPSRVAAARSRSLCRYQVRDIYPHPIPLPERARETKLRNKTGGNFLTEVLDGRQR